MPLALLTPLLLQRILKSLFERMVLSMATIKELNNGTFKITVTLGKDANGNKIRKCINYKPKAKSPKAILNEVNKYANNYEYDLINGNIKDGNHLTLNDIISEWQTETSEDIQKGTLQTYRMYLDKYVLNYIGFKKLSNITAYDLQELVNKWSVTLKPSSVRRRFAAIRSIIKYCYQKDLIKENICNRVKLPKNIDSEQDKLHYFTPEQFKTFLNACDLEYTTEYKAHTRTLKSTGENYNVPEYSEKHTIPFQYKVMFSLLVDSGIRRGELLALTWHDIDFQKNEISITKSIGTIKDDNNKDIEIVKCPKTVSSNRTLAITQGTIDLLKKWKAKEKVLMMKLGTKWQGERQNFDDNFIFIQLENGLRMNLSTPRHKFTSIIKQYNEQYAETETDKLPLIRLHDLRHTSATILLSKGIDIETVSKRLGHSKASTTLDIYGHATKETDRQAAELLESVLNI